MNEFLFLIVVGLVVARITWLITYDYITERFRELPSKYTKLNYFLNCPWCVSVWVAIPIVSLSYLYWDILIVKLVLFSIAIMQLSAMLVEFSDRNND